MNQSIGRPTDSNKTIAILDTALKLFSSRGLEATSIESIAAESRVAKSTIYARFGNKINILEAVIKNFTMPIQQVWQEVSSENSIEERINSIGIALAVRVESREISRLEPVVMMAMIKYPKVADAFYYNGPGKVIEELTKFIDLAIRDGELTTIDETPSAAVMAEDLLGLWRGANSHVFKARSEGKDTVEKKELEVQIHRGTKLFLKLYGQ
ncbi:TetR/AcrR family transcriptional regulator [Glaciecola petra]|uniref:TetR/AcrR family transcriptional regulator n=1 Tax=Glaciecola petra TaxID=3075602 RepID=A0ABU2ZQH6_9ALTE|nr:TetR/AcrR family transcriptional regulator [Aestuariibacter sp. P117]MDT0594886.1 TetR/AcrR family transcriptional regulator [Aestuariibacter sp. P117]